MSLILTKKYIITYIFLLFNIYNLNATPNDRYAGIEVGSKGVKLCIMNSKVEGLDLTKKIEFETSINTDFIRFTLESEELTALAIYNLYFYAIEKYKIPSNQIYIAVSSGVLHSSIREEKSYMINALTTKVKDMISQPNKSIEIISLDQESIWTFKSIVPEDDNMYMKTIVIDIGSGNTKGGYFISKGVFNKFTIDWASKSLYNYVEQRSDTNSDNLMFFIQLQKKLDELSKKDIPEAIDKCGITNFDFNIIFSGGIVWSSATLIKPEKLKDKKITVTYDELNSFYNQIYKNYKKYTSKNKSNEYIEEKTKIEAVFNQRSLMAGTGLLLKIMRKFEPISNSKKFILAKDNRSGWLPAYIQEKINKKKTSKN
jgi:hypothetical protein